MPTTSTSCTSPTPKVWVRSRLTCASNVAGGINFACDQDADAHHVTISKKWPTDQASLHQVGRATVLHCANILAVGDSTAHAHAASPNLPLAWPDGRAPASSAPDGVLLTPPAKRFKTIPARAHPGLLFFQKGRHDIAHAKWRGPPDN